MTKRFITKYDENYLNAKVSSKFHAFLYHSHMFNDLYKCTDPLCPYNPPQVIHYIPLERGIEIGKRVIEKYSDALKELDD